MSDSEHKNITAQRMSMHDTLCSLSNGCSCKWIAESNRQCDECDCTCDIIADARKDERMKLQRPWVDESYYRGYRNGRTDAANAVNTLLQGRIDDDALCRIAKRTALGARAESPELP